jgi:hypothetical protein
MRSDITITQTIQRVKFLIGLINADNHNTDSKLEDFTKLNVSRTILYYRMIIIQSSYTDTQIDNKDRQIDRQTERQTDRQQTRDKQTDR